MTDARIFLRYHHEKNIDSNCHDLHPGRLAWNLKITQLKRKIIFQTISFRFHVNLPGCNDAGWISHCLKLRLAKGSSSRLGHGTLANFSCFQGSVFCPPFLGISLKKWRFCNANLKYHWQYKGRDDDIWIYMIWLWLMIFTEYDSL